jgi:predicted helicase
MKIKQLKELTNADVSFLSNARCLAEGIDLPNLDGVAFIDPRNSEIDIVQAVGRAIRLSKGKAIG